MVKKLFKLVVLGALAFSIISCQRKDNEEKKHNEGTGISAPAISFAAKFIDSEGNNLVTENKINIDSLSFAYTDENGEVKTCTSAPFPAGYNPPFLWEDVPGFVSVKKVYNDKVYFLAGVVDWIYNPENYRHESKGYYTIRYGNTRKEILEIHYVNGADFNYYISRIKHNGEWTQEQEYTYNGNKTFTVIWD